MRVPWLMLAFVSLASPTAARILPLGSSAVAPASTGVKTCAMLNKLRGGAVAPRVAASALLTTAQGAGALTALVYAAEVGARKLSTVVAVPAVVAQSLVGMAWFLALYASGLVTSVQPQILTPGEPQNPEWYKGLRKPSWMPPGFLFPIMWLLIAKPTQLSAIYCLSRQGGAGVLSAPILVYIFHLALGETWNKVFFEEQQVGFGLAVIYVFFAALLLATKLFWTVSPAAGCLMLPTVAWVTVASTLNLRIYQMNRPKAF